MTLFYRLPVALAAAFLIAGCSAEQPPLDSEGKTPQQVLMETYTLILEEKYTEAEKRFSPEFVKALITDNKSTFVEYCNNTKGWQREWLKTKLVGNDYNENLWRVKIIPDEGKGAHNGPGIVQDLYMIDGEWKIVFWQHYPKS